MSIYRSTEEVYNTYTWYKIMNITARTPVSLSGNLKPCKWCSKFICVHMCERGDYYFSSILVYIIRWVAKNERKILLHIRGLQPFDFADKIDRDTWCTQFLIHLWQ